MRRLLRDCREHLLPARTEILLTLNIEEPAEGLERLWPGALTIIRNPQPKGFGANHNAALARARGRFLAAIDPELRLHGNPFEGLALAFGNARLGVASTRVVEADGRAADNARRAPSPLRLLQRYTWGERPLYDLALSRAQRVDWVAGLFMAFRADTFRALNGFDERFFMYCEDADLCLRAWNAGYEVQVVPAAMVSHRAQRATRRTLRHLRWHVQSLARLWSAQAYRDFRQLRLREERRAARRSARDTQPD